MTLIRKVIVIRGYILSAPSLNLNDAMLNIYFDFKFMAFNSVNETVYIMICFTQLGGSCRSRNRDKFVKYLNGQTDLP